MNTLLATGLFVLMALGAKAQDQKLVTDSTTVTTLQQEPQDINAADTAELNNPLRITSAYAGQITGIGFSTKTPSDISTYSSTRLGGGASYDITKGVSLQMMGILDISPKEGETFAFGQAFLKSKIGQQWVISTGLLATSATLLRPFPVDWTGHFETSTDALIPGGAPGFRVDHNVGPVTASAGVAMRKGMPEYGANVGYKTGDDEKANLAGWYQNDDVFGLVLSGTYKAFSGALVWNEAVDQSRVGAKALYGIDVPGRSGSLALFAVANRDLAQPEKKMMNGLVGVLTVGKVHVGTAPVQVVIGPGYDVVNNNVVMYLQLALQK